MLLEKEIRVCVCVCDIRKSSK